MKLLVERFNKIDLLVKNNFSQKQGYWISICLFFIGIYLLHFLAAQQYFLLSLCFYTLCFAGYLGIYFFSSNNDKSPYYIPVIASTIVLFSFPNFSDDIYRFWWDGYVSHLGIHAFAFKPTALIQLSTLSETTQEILKSKIQLLNSPEYYSVYPNICQYLFKLNAFLAEDNIYYFSTLLKFEFWLINLVCIFVAQQYFTIQNISKKYIFLLFANPLYILECIGNLHFEIFSVFGIFLSLYFLSRSKFILSGIGLGIGIISKLLSLIFLPFFILQIGYFWRKQFGFILGLSICLLSFVLYFIGYETHLSESLQLYFHQFAFNSIFYSPLKFCLDNYLNTDTKVLSGNITAILFVLFAGIFFLWELKCKNKFNLSFQLWIILYLYLLFSSTVHPWYIIPLLTLGIMNHSFTSIAWTYLIFFSYVHYDATWKVYQNFTTFLEYGLIIVLSYYELKKKYFITQVSQGK